MPLYFLAIDCIKSLAFGKNQLKYFLIIHRYLFDRISIPFIFENKFLQDSYRFIQKEFMSRFEK